ncbi:MAG: hypothetical protein SH859_12520 [Hyphomicrobium aestuarii]|nr:hypothetical protein [Hyphomicrobium aestuarii]
MMYNSLVIAFLMAASAVSSITVATAAPAGFPLPFQPAQDIMFRSSAGALSGKFVASDGKCQINLAVAEAGASETRAIAAGAKSRIRFGDSEVEVFCCPQLTLVTLRDVRRAVALTN